MQSCEKQSTSHDRVACGATFRSPNLGVFSFCINSLKFAGTPLCTALLKFPLNHFPEVEIWTLTGLLHHLGSIVAVLGINVLLHDSLVIG